MKTLLSRHLGLGRGVAPILAACFVLGGASSAAAAEPDQKAAAQALFEEGRDLVRDGKFAQACPKLAQSLKLDPGTGTMLWLADCYENAGQTASAWAQFKDAAASAALSRDPREKVARKRVDALEGRLTKLVIVVPPDARVVGLEVRRDGVVVGDVEFGMALPLDPGRHVVSASAAGREGWSVDVEIPARPDSVVVDVPLLTTKSAAGAHREPEGKDAAAPSTAGSSSSPLRIIGLSTAGAGLVAMGVGAFLGFKAKSTYDDSNNGHCNSQNVCDTEGKALRSSADGTATGATIAVGAGAAAVIGGLVLYFVAPRDTKASVGLVPVMGPRQAGLILQHSF